MRPCYLTSSGAPKGVRPCYLFIIGGVVWFMDTQGWLKIKRRPWPGGADMLPL